MIPINVDVNVSPRSYAAHAARRELLVTKIFKTIQGEGPYAGRPAIFLRLAGCNIGAKKDCPWCDTAFHFASGSSMPMELVLGTIDELSDKSAINLIVVTGGEPLLQWEVMCDMIRMSQGRGRYIWQFETNGNYLKDDVLRAVTDFLLPVYFVVSPKVSSSTGRYPPVRECWHTLGGRLTLKYIVEDNPAGPYNTPGPSVASEDLKPLLTYISGMTVYRRLPDPDRPASVWDPSLIDREATALNYRHAANIVLFAPTHYRLSLQTHLFVGVE